MQHYIFIATDSAMDFSAISVESLVDAFPDLESVVLSNDEELMLFLKLIGIQQVSPMKVSATDFSKYWDLSNYSLPEFDEKEFEDIFSRWIDITNKERTMDEYANLIFFSGKTSEWNKLKFRYVLKEVSC